MLHEALMLEIYRQALNAGALPATRPRSTESAHSSERCPSHDSNSSENGRSDTRDAGNMLAGMHPNSATFPSGLPHTLAAHPPSMEAYLQMVAAAAQQYGFPLGVAATPTLPLPLPSDVNAHFKLPQPQASPTASSNNSEALDFRTSTFARSESAEPAASEDEEEEEGVEEEEVNNADNPLDLSVGGRKRSADQADSSSTVGKIQVKKVFKTENSTLPAPVVPTASLLPPVNPYLAAVAAANIFRSGQFPDWNGKSDLVVDPLEKMSDIVKGPRKDKTNRATGSLPSPQNIVSSGTQTSTTNSLPSATPASTETTPKTRHNIWQSHWQNKGVASSVFRCVWCKQSFPTLEALTTHMKDSKHCGVNVPPFSNLPNTERSHQSPQTPSAQSLASQHSHNLRKHNNNNNNNADNSGGVSAAAKNAFQYRGDPPTPLPRKLVRGQNVWLGKGVEQAMQILKCMRCGESFRSLGEMTKHMQETQHYTNILSQEQTISMKSTGASGDNKDGQSLSSEESRTLSAVLTCKVCDKAFNSLGDLSNHMAKNNHYAEPLMQSMGGGAHRKRPAPKKREKSLPVRKLLEMKGAQLDTNHAESKMGRPYDNAKHMKMDMCAAMTADKSDTALFAERMRQYITGVKATEDMKIQPKTKSPEIELKNGTNKTSTGGPSSVLSAIEQMFATSFDTPVRHNNNLPASSPSNSSTKNTSPVASSILKRLGIDETVDYNKPLMDTSDPYYQHYRYTSSERSGSECSAETQIDSRKLKNEKPEEIPLKATAVVLQSDKEAAGEQEEVEEKSEAVVSAKVDIKTEAPEEDNKYKSETEEEVLLSNGAGNNESKSVRCSPKNVRSPTDSQRSVTPKSPESSSVKSYDGEKKYPSDSLNALSSMFDSLGSSSTNTNRSQSGHKIESPDHINSTINTTITTPSTTNSLSALRQFCVKKEKTS